MKFNVSLPAGYAVLAFSLMTSGCIVHEHRHYEHREAVYQGPGNVVYVQAAPPPLRVETVAVAPHPGYVWVAGDWTWRDRRWVWEEGRWGRPPHPGAVYVPNHYAYQNGRHIWIRGGWH